MAKAPTLVLTRPRIASEEIARGFAGAVVISPVLEICGTGAKISLERYAGVVLTSSNAVPFLPDLSGVPAYVVGARTAEVSGADVRLVARDADDLVARIKAQGPLVHAHGVVTRGDVARRLTLAGIETDSVVVYRQDAVALTDEARQVLAGEDPAILPLYSPRSAQLVADQVRTLGPNIRVLALSQAVAEAWGRACEVCDRPDGAEMIGRIDAAFNG